uniref:Rhamnogalacturonan II specific xylosyltransferase n=1 Tax=Tetraselmis sp. GSL018 TaxID=582737 RepID=A0A061RZA6_9CHLO
MPAEDTGSLQTLLLPRPAFPSYKETLDGAAEKTQALVLGADLSAPLEAVRSTLTKISAWQQPDSPPPPPLPRSVSAPRGVAPAPKQLTSRVVILSFTNRGALNWLWHLDRAIGRARFPTTLRMYVVGDETRQALVSSGLIPAECIRDGSVGTTLDASHSSKGFHYDSPGFNKLAAQRPRIILHAIKELERTAAEAVVYCDVDAVWKRDALPALERLAPTHDIAGSRDDYLVCTGFVMFRTRSADVISFLSEWEEKLSTGSKVNQYVFNELLKAQARKLSIQRLPHEQFPSGLEYFHKRRTHNATALVIHANYFQGQAAKRGKLKEAGLWQDVPHASQA